MKHLVLVIFLSAAGMLRADSAPSALIWSDPPTKPGDATSSGIEVLTDCFEQSAGCAADDTVYRSFTVTSPGTFALGISESSDLIASMCNPFTCVPSAFVSEAISGDTYISGTSDGVNISDSGRGGSVCFGCDAFLDLDDADGVRVNLGLGSYTLELDYSALMSGSDFTGGDINFDSLLVPYPTTLVITPEPTGSASALVLAFSFFGLARSRTKRQTA